jgi:hypothetical protein
MRKSNCIIFALWLWFKGHCKGMLCVKRSIGKRGRIPHFLHITEHGPWITMLEYEPKQRKENISDSGDFPLVFNGRIIAKTFVLVDEKELASSNDALLESKGFLRYSSKGNK